MGKGSNVQKKQQAQLRNAKDRGKTDEERKAAADKAKYVHSLLATRFRIG